MNIQDMVDRRIKELRAQAGMVEEEVALQEAPACDYQDELSPLYGKRFDPPFRDILEEREDVPMDLDALLAVSAPRRRSGDSLQSGQPGSSRTHIEEFTRMVDTALGEVAGRVLEITERLADDYMRLEKDMLQSRLEILASVESVLDIAVSLRHDARSLLAGTDRRLSGRHADADRFAAHRPFASRQSLLRERANMHDRGVAALFRRTL